MSGYGGNPDIDTEQQLIMAENEIVRARKLLEQQALRPSASHCLDCGESIAELRRQLVPGVLYCIQCQPAHDKVFRTKMTSGALD